MATWAGSAVRVVPTLAAQSSLKLPHTSIVCAQYLGDLSPANHFTGANGS